MNNPEVIEKMLNDMREEAERITGGACRVTNRQECCDGSVTISLVGEIQKHTFFGLEVRDLPLVVCNVVPDIEVQHPVKWHVNLQEIRQAVMEHFARIEADTAVVFIPL
jgi:hypothetical protein